jgi:hypothetical protein
MGARKITAITAQAVMTIRDMTILRLVMPTPDFLAGRRDFGDGITLRLPRFECIYVQEPIVFLIALLVGTKEAEMRIIGCDLHARQQTVAMLDTTTGEVAKTIGY